MKFVINKNMAGILPSGWRDIIDARDDIVVTDGIPNYTSGTATRQYPPEHWYAAAQIRAERERSEWNKAVDERKAERQLRRNWR